MADSAPVPDAGNGAGSPELDVSLGTATVRLQPPFTNDGRFGWCAELPPELLPESDGEGNTRRSPWRLFEDGNPIGIPHALHDDIRGKGEGAYSHWQDTLYFSTSDNSDPNGNGRRYELQRHAEGAKAVATARPVEWLPAIGRTSPSNAEASSLADILRRRQVREVVYFHTDHFEPWDGTADQQRRALERFAQLTGHSRFGGRLSLFLTPLVQFALAEPGSESEYVVAAADNVAFWRRPLPIAERCRSLLRPLEAEIGHEFHIHIHHENWTRTGLANPNHDVRAWVVQHSTPEADANRFDLFVRLCREVMEEDLGRPLEKWGFVHGMWALNASDPQYCQLENEMAVLMRYGCFGDFTFPAPNPHSQPTLIEYPYTCLPVRSVKAYDSPTSDPQPISRGSGLIGPDRFFIWNSPVGPDYSSLDFSYEGNRELFKTPEVLVQTWLEQSVIVDDRLYIKTHAHSLSLDYRVWEPDAAIPHTYPDTIKVFELLQEVCDCAVVAFKPATVGEVMDNLRSFDRGEPREAPKAGAPIGMPEPLKDAVPAASLTPISAAAGLNVAAAEPGGGQELPEAPLRQTLVSLHSPFDRVPAIGKHCWRLPLPTELLGDADDLKAEDRSPWRLLEDGVLIGQAHAPHDLIGTVGRGAFSHWVDTLYFSTSDNSNPNQNGRQYALERPPSAAWPAPAIETRAWDGAAVDRLKVVLRRRDVKEIVYFHTDHFEPWGGRSDDERWRGLERFARLSRHSSFGHRLSLFYTPWLVHVLASASGPAAYRNGDDGVAFKERSPGFLERCVQLIRPLETEIGHEFHIHVHHEGWTRSAVEDAVALWVRGNSTPASDSRRFEFYLKLCREVLGEEIGRPFDNWAFVHGNWSLNASDPQSCCIENEMAVLLGQGCFGDFTFPAPNVRCNPNLIEYPYTCLPVSGAKSYDRPDADPRPLSHGEHLLTPDRFLIWNSPIKAAHSSLDFYEPENHRLFRQPEALVRAWLEQSVIVDGCLYLKTHAHSLHHQYRPWDEEAYFPHTHPDLVRVFDLLEEVGDAAATPITLATVCEVVDHLRRYDRGEGAPVPAAGGNAAVERVEARPRAPAVRVADLGLPRVKTVLAAAMHEIERSSATTRPIDSYYASRVARGAVLETYETAFIDYARAKLPAAECRIFEVGIGWGMLSICLAALGYEVVGFVGQHDHAKAARFLHAKAAAVAPHIDDNLTIIEGMFPDALPLEMLGSDKQNVMLSTNVVNSFTAENDQRILDAGARFDMVIIETGTFGVSREGEARQRFRQQLESRFTIVETVWRERMLVMQPRRVDRPAAEIAARLELQPSFSHAGGFAWIAQLPAELVAECDDLANHYRSPWRLVEDGRRIGIPHALHDDIHKDGRGRYSHWKEVLYFSSRDNTDPNHNGRQYGLVRFCI